MIPVDPLKLLALYTRDLLELPESQIKFGRSNHDKLDFSQDLIVIDGLSPSVGIGTQKQYDGNTEKKIIAKTVTGEFTLIFYGDNALLNAQSWSTLNESQEARNIASDLVISVHRPTGITDLKMLTGSKYNNRFEITVKMSYNITNELELLRIDSSQIDMITDNPTGSFTISAEV